MASRFAIVGLIWLSGSLSAQVLQAAPLSTSTAASHLLRNSRRLLSKEATPAARPLPQRSSSPRPRRRASSPPPAPSSPAPVHSSPVPSQLPSQPPVYGDPTPTVPVCASVGILPPSASGAAPSNAWRTTVDCAVFADLVAQGWAWAADAQGARIATPFTLKTCTPGSQLPGSLDLPSIEVCGAFASAAEAERLAGSVNALFNFWSWYPLTGQVPSRPVQTYIVMCPPMGYRYRAFVYSPLESLIAYQETAC